MPAWGKRWDSGKRFINNGEDQATKFSDHLRWVSQPKTNTGGKTLDKGEGGETFQNASNKASF